MRSLEHVEYNNFTTTQGPFDLRGGTYAVTVAATFSTGTLTLQIISPDGVNWVNVDTAFSANAFKTYALPPNTYRILVGGTGLSAAYVHFDRIPGE